MKIWNVLKKYWRNNFIAVDQLINALCFGDPDETISSRLGKAKHTSKAAAFFAWWADLLFVWQGYDSHVDHAEEPDEGKDQIF